MSIPLLIHWILIECILVVDSAPKIQLRSLRNDIYDPMIESSDSYLSYEMPVPKLRTQMSAEVAKPHNDGYIFNENYCKEVNKRILCGYDKNKGEYFNQYEIIDMGNGCRSRGDRIECGYDNGPYNNHLRRPTQNEVHEEEHEGEDHSELARQAPTRTGQPTTGTDQETTPKIYQELKLNNKLLNDVFDKLLKKSSNKHAQTQPTTLSTELFEPVTSTSTIPETVTTVTTTEFETTQVPESNQTFDSTITETAPALLTTETSTLTGQSSELEDISSDSEAMKRIVQIGNNNDEEKTPILKRRLTEVLSTLAVSNTESNTNIVSSITPTFVSNCESTSNTGLRMKTSSGEMISTACVEKQDRVVCYDFKT